MQVYYIACLVLLCYYNCSLLVVDLHFYCSMLTLSTCSANNTVANVVLIIVA